MFYDLFLKMLPFWLVGFVITLVSEIIGRNKAKKRKSNFDPMLLQFILNQQQQIQQQMDQQAQQQMDQVTQEQMRMLQEQMLQDSLRMQQEVDQQMQQQMNQQMQDFNNQTNFMNPF